MAVLVVVVLRQGSLTCANLTVYRVKKEPSYWTGQHYIRSYVRMHLSPSTQMCGCQLDNQPAATTALQKPDYRF